MLAFDHVAASQRQAFFTWKENVRDHCEQVVLCGALKFQLSEIQFSKSE